MSPRASYSLCFDVVNKTMCSRRECGTLINKVHDSRIDKEVADPKMIIRE